MRRIATVALIVAVVGAAILAVLVISPASPSAITAASTNVFGDLSNGNCKVNSNSKIQCGSQFPACEQAYAWPWYYYDKLIWMADYTQRTDDPTQMQSVAIAMAQNACDNPSPYISGSPTITLPQIASVFLDVTGAAHAADCAAALIIAAGECQWSAGGAWGSSTCATDGVYAGCAGAAACVSTVNNGIWQNGVGVAWTPQESAAALFDPEQATSVTVLCTGAPAAVPSDYISAGNSNFIGSFCHVNKYQTTGSFAFGGGQCSGGLGPNPPSSSCQCPAA